MRNTCRFIAAALVLLAGGSASAGNIPNADGSSSLQVAPWVGKMADCSGSIATGGTSQVLLTTNSMRRYLLIQNLSSGNLGIREDAAASIGSAGTTTIAPGGFWLFEAGFIPTNALNIVGPTTGQVFTCKQG